jgi:hypothetical protein
LLPLSALIVVPRLAHAAEELVLDTWTGAPNVAWRDAGAAPGSWITIANDPVTISSIAVRVDLDSAGNLTFVILSHPDHEVIHVSEPQFFADDGMTWKKSSPPQPRFRSIRVAS